jgi:hypothetical protein
LMARVVLSVLTRKDVAVISSLAPLKSAWRPNRNRKSGQMMCYKPRTSSRATDRTAAPQTAALLLHCCTAESRPPDGFMAEMGHEPAYPSPRRAGGMSAMTA